ncbi:MAG: hypothetical protein ABI895_11880 [Deltaproteobacteria bacterium]
MRKWSWTLAMGIGALSSGCAGVVEADSQPAPESEEVTFELSDGVMTTGQFDFPQQGQPPFPGVLLIQGSDVADRDETVVYADGSIDRPFLQITNELTERGLAVFRFDKRGVCRPALLCDAAALSEQTPDLLSRDATRAYERMIASSFIDGTHTAVLGHSEGTWLAPLVAGNHPEIGALALIGTGLGPMHVLQATQVTLPLLGAAGYDADGDGALTFEELTPRGAAETSRLLEHLRPVGRIFLFQYAGHSSTLEPIALNARLDSDGNGALALVGEVRLAYESFLEHIDDPLIAIERYADPGILPIAAAMFASAGTSQKLLAAYLAQPMDSNLRSILAATSRPRVLIANGEYDDQTPAASAQLLYDALSAANYPADLRIYPGLSHGLSLQADAFSEYNFRMESGPLTDIGEFLAESLRRP